MSEQPAEYLQGAVERLTFHSTESGYTVARFKAPRTPELVTRPVLSLLLLSKYLSMSA